MTTTPATGRSSTSTAAQSGRLSMRWSTVFLFVSATWLASPVFLLLQNALGLDTEVLMLVQFAPASAALFVIAMRHRSDAALSARLLSALRVGDRTVLRAGTGTALIAGVLAFSWLLTSLADHHLQALHIHGLGHPLLLIVIAQFVGAAGEELGWRCLLLPYLQRRFTQAVAAVVVGVIWASWHIQYYSFGAIFMIGFAVMCIAVTSIMMTCQQGTRRGSLYITTSVHWALNLGILLLLPIGDAHVMTMTCLAVSATAVAVIAHIRVRTAFTSAS